MSDIIFFENLEEFSGWLGSNSTINNEIWVGYFKKSSWQASLTWSESVDAALCFGWIDGIRKTVDEERYKIRFTPRKLNSVWSAINIKKVGILIKNWKIKPAGLHVFENRSHQEGYSSDSRNVPFSKKYEEKIKENKKAWTFFTSLAPCYKRDTIYWVMSAKKEETQLRRLSILIDSAEWGLKIPMLRKNK